MKTDLSKTKVLLVITKSNWGGAQQYVYTLATNLSARGADVAVALGGTGAKTASVGELAKRLADANIRTIVLLSFARDISFFREWSALFSLVKTLRKERPSVLHLNSSKAGGIGALAGRIAGVERIVFTAHGWPHEEPRARVARALIWLASYATVLLCHKVIVLSNQQKTGAPAIFARKRLSVIPNGVEDFAVTARAQARALFVSLNPNLKNYRRWILSTSELHKNKGIDILIDAFADLATTHTDTALVLTNDGEQREYLIEHARDAGIGNRVFFMGFVKNVRSLLSVADVFVLPSRKEGLPFALLEAGHASLPVVASAVGSVGDIIKNEVTGILIQPENTENLSKAVCALLDDQNLATRLAQTLHKHIAEHFSSTKMLKKTFTLYTRL